MLTYVKTFIFFWKHPKCLGKEFLLLTNFKNSQKADFFQDEKERMLMSQFQDSCRERQIFGAIIK
jgi:hypothetical protein